MKHILAAIGNVLSFALGLVSIPVALFMGLLFTALPIIFVLWILGVWPVDEDANDDNTPTAAECYWLKATNELDAIIVSLCFHCPDLMGDQWCSDFRDLHLTGLNLFEDSCLSSLLQPTMTPELLHDCDAVERLYGPAAAECDPAIAGRMLEWDIRYCED